MRPQDADFGFVIDFRKGQGNPRRVFDAASSLIDAFADFDRAVTASVDSKIEPIVLLEDVEAGSLRVWLRNILRRVNDEALKDLEWKKQVGKYLVKAKYIALEYLEDDKQAFPRLQDLKETLRKLAQDTDIRHLPDYPPVHDGRLISSLDKIQAAKRELEPGDALTIDLGDEEYKVDLEANWMPSEAMPEVPVSENESSTEVDMVLMIRKPDLIKSTMWQFSHGLNTIVAPIHDEAWLSDLHSRKIPIFSGDALKCRVVMRYYYSNKGELIDQKFEIVRVHGIISGGEHQQPMVFG